MKTIGKTLGFVWVASLLVSGVQASDRLSNELVTSEGFVWSLISQGSSTEEFWMDHSTGMVWSSAVKGLTLDESRAHCFSKDAFNLPSAEQIAQAHANGIREVIESLRGTFWTSTPGLKTYPSQRVYESSNGAIGYGWAMARFSAVCVSETR